MNQGRTEDAVVILALSLTPGMGNTRVNQTLALAQCCGWDIPQLRQVSNPSFLRRVLEQDAAIAAQLRHCEAALFEKAQAYISRALARGLQVLHILEDAYPQSIRMHLGAAAPPVLFLWGNAALVHATAGAVVGTRNPSPGGIRAAGKAARTIVARATSLVSGGAAGVDRAGHDAALKTKSNTVVLLPQGILSWSLPGSWRSAFGAGRIAVLSACLPDAPWQTHAAVSRNALISAMAQVVCVVEPRKQGGSIQTTRHAVGQGKPVFVEPLDALPVSLRVQARPLHALTAVLPELDLERMLREKNDGNRQRDLF